jgi:hypothetical protein
MRSDQLKPRHEVRRSLGIFSMAGANLEGEAIRPCAHNVELPNGVPLTFTRNPVRGRDCTGFAFNEPSDELSGQEARPLPA